MSKSSHQRKNPHFIGPIGGAITKSLVERGEKELIKKEGKES
ncbi:MAG: hypothetical protein RR630_08215 [Coprobacillus sp.]